VKASKTAPLWRVGIVDGAVVICADENTWASSCRRRCPSLRMERSRCQGNNAVVVVAVVEDDSKTVEDKCCCYCSRRAAVVDIVAVENTENRQAGEGLSVVANWKK
jgi:hypothetical protein